MDLSIKEALNTLRSSSRKSNTLLKINLSPTSVGRVPSEPGTPRSRSMRRYQDVKPKVVAQSQGVKSVAKLKEKKGVGELDEFLETEKMVQNQYFITKKGGDKRTESNLKKVEKCRRFITMKMSQGFTSGMVKRIIFSVWKAYKFE